MEQARALACPLGLLLAASLQSAATSQDDAKAIAV